MMRNWGWWLVLAGLLSACAAGPQPGPGMVTAAPVAAAAVVIDVRDEAEWKAGHLEGAVLIPHDRIAERIGAVVPDKQTRIYLYCRTGRRTGIAFEALRKAGYGNLINLKTMENAAQTLGKPIVK